VFEHLTDLIVVLDRVGNLRYTNPFTVELLGYDPAEVIGRSIADYLHPDDLARAIEVMALLVDGQLMVPVTPALYRLRHADGTWYPIEINASVLPDPVDGSGDDDLTLVIGRYSGDHDLQDRIVGLLTAGAPIPEVMQLVPGFGEWRHPHEHYAVLYSDRDERAVAGSPLAAELLTLDHSSTSPWAQAAETGRDAVVEVRELRGDLRARAEAEDLLACWAMPVPDPLTGQPAVLLAWSRDDGPAPTVHRYSLETMARSLDLILQWRAQVAELEQAARRDPLTNVTNRTGFFEELRHDVDRLDDDTRMAVLYIDLDGFKEVNDHHGHAIGDAVLVATAARISAAVRRADLVARLGGDEFAVLCRSSTSDADLTHVADRIIASLNDPIDAGGAAPPLLIGASVGIAACPLFEIRPQPDLLVDRADRALYQAKALGRGRWHLADS
jgi:diguanylate cyclase (GGDEF)-like protein/PAS domain S-box-containing protein